MRSTTIVLISLILPITGGMVALAWISFRGSPAFEADSTILNSRVPTAPTLVSPFVSNDSYSRAIPSSEPRESSLLAPILTSLQKWTTETDPKLKEAKMRELIALITASNASLIVQGLSPAFLDTPFGVAALDQWAQVDRKSAAEWMAKEPMTTDAQAAAIARTWWREDREAFQSYCDQLPDGEWRQKVLIAASYEAIAGNPTEAITWAARLSPDDRQTGLLQAATLEWTRQDPKAAISWLGQVSDPHLQERLIGAAAVGYATIDPRSAVSWLLGSVKNEEILKVGVTGIVQSWAAREPAEAGAWIANFPRGPTQTSAVESLLAIWRTADRAAAYTWVSSLPAGPLRSQATQFLTSSRSR